MPTYREFYGVGVFNDKIYVAGGMGQTENEESVNLDIVEVYDPKTNEWSSVANMNLVRTSPAMLAFDGKLFALGSQDDGDVGRDTWEFYDPELDTWTLMDKMDGNVYPACAVVMKQYEVQID